MFNSLEGQLRRAFTEIWLLVGSDRSELIEGADRSALRFSEGVKRIIPKELATRLGDLGIHETERNINNKISRGGFTAVFFVQCLVAAGCQSIRLVDD